ncbi:cation:proton antiporter [Francisella adeliensis]|uniref:Sodium:proton antiporter n=1 Tax=Francisella adeliensis TaxID=2007306 RepID=A0A2Z4Y0Y6_9GAMM|nr:sodium:proton antiporter [Francisella adeliensis]AXA34363.1 sodium:proton antiporter [Francisella adeliensis]MBK2086450.1 sodium:proton antiporter [Francisella adeliensis]MBK2096078.1 sodium:proton antiporter [Francisella adeliensis]QIW12610.1 sodium:proton antiporter [Francisella adeliensis]QIW14483.1 sodium:proton antiporter [Francisella adeliensis]
MSHHSLFVLLCIITALASYINLKYLKLPKPVGLIVISAGFSLILLVLINFKPHLFDPVYNQLDSVNFKAVVLHGMLGYLLFASAMHLNLLNLKKHFLGVLTLSSIGVVISTFIIGTLGWLIIPMILGKQLPYVVYLLVGAIVSPTDPVTVFAVFKKNKNVPTRVKSLLEGESLFNDVISIVLFMILVSITFGSNTDISILHIAELFLQESLGGILLGVLLGVVGMSLMHNSDDSHTLIIISLAIVSSGFWLAQQLEVSGPLVMVVSGLIIGNSKFKSRLSNREVKKFTDFWLTIDELLNAFLFVLVGIKILELDYSNKILFVGIVSFIITVIARYISVAISVFLRNRGVPKDYSRNNIVMTWAGLRGGVSIALALSLPMDSRYVLLFSIVYIVVILSIFIQGTTFKNLLDKFYG